MKYIVEFEVEDGDCQLYQNVNPSNPESACRSCPLRYASYCVDLNMHKAKIIKANLEL